MAKVNISYDTKTKDCSITIDGQPISNVEEIIIMKNLYIEEEGKEDNYRMDLILRQESESDDVVITTDIRASKQLEEKYSNSKIVAFKDYKIPDRSQLIESVSRMIGKK